MGGFADWLSQTPLSETIGAHGWITPAVQTIHILALAILAGAVLMTSLKALDVLGADRSLTQFSQAFAPWFACAMAALLLSGGVLIAGEPKRALENPIFYFKMSLLLLALALTSAIYAPLRRDSDFWKPTAIRRITLRATAGAALAVWAGIVFAGRWIAYAGN